MRTSELQQIEPVGVARREVKLIMVALVLAVIGMVTAACSHPTAPEAPQPVRYELFDIGGSALPWTDEVGSTVHSGFISLNSDSSYIDVLTYDAVSAVTGAKLTITDTVRGEYRIVGALIALRASNGFVQAAGYNGSELTLLYGRPWRYRR